MISLLTPTRGRPHNMQRLVESVLDTALNPQNIEVVFYIDSDDKASQKKAKELRMPFKVGQRILLSQMWNEVYKIAKGDIYMHCGDDIVFRTHGWDGMVREAFDKYDDKICFVYGRDGYAPDTFGTHGFIHRNWVETVGYFVPPFFSSDFNDTWLNEVAEGVGRHVFLQDMLTEHMHPVVNKGEWDKTHMERLKRHQDDDVEKIYNEKKINRNMDIVKLRRFIKNYGK